MSETHLFPGSVLSLPARAAERLLERGSGDAALLYLYLLRTGGAYDGAAAAKALRWGEERTGTAYQELARMGLAPKREDGSRSEPAPAAAPEAPEEPPEYSAADISKELEDKASPFPGLVGEVQRRLGKVLSTADLKTLYTIYDFLALPAEVICLLVSWCVEEQERKYGPGRRPRMPQVRKEAFLWRRLGLDTTEGAEEYLKRQAVLRTREGGILALLGVTGRGAVEGERRYIAAWVEMGFPDEAIRLAYERTVFKKQAMNWPYMNSILKSWHQKGLHTVEEIESKDSGRAPSPTRPAAPAQAERRVNEDIQWMQEFLARQKAAEGGN